MARSFRTALDIVLPPGRFVRRGRENKPKIAAFTALSQPFQREKSGRGIYFSEALASAKSLQVHEWGDFFCANGRGREATGFPDRREAAGPAASSGPSTAIVAAYALFRFYDWAIACHIPMKSNPGPDRLVRSIVLAPRAVQLFRLSLAPDRNAGGGYLRSGDAGWGGWEDSVCRAMAANGCEVLGIDFVLYAKTDYDLATLQADYTQLGQRARGPFGDPAPPLILGGWSMGAEQAVPAAAGPHPPSGLAGLLLLSPGKRGQLRPAHVGQARYSAGRPRHLRAGRLLQKPREFTGAAMACRARSARFDDVAADTGGAASGARFFRSLQHFNGPSDVFVQEMVRASTDSWRRRLNGPCASWKNKRRRGLFCY